ncbi:MAG: pyridoxamine 5'-phosphate oxidase family protein [Deltaproteobacteria bacterium]|nr:pyridoxamine 5'-phosphate oxidase family protein [Deltaproteobacteria bacterium]
MSEKTKKTEAQQNTPGSRDELREMLRHFRTAMLVTHDTTGMPRARPLVIVKVEDDARVWFATTDHSPKIREITGDAAVAVVCHRSSDEAWISVSGHARLVRDRQRAHAMWSPGLQAWFSGPDDPALLLIEVVPTHAEYYGADRPMIARAFQLAKGILTREPPKTGPIKHVELERLSDPGRLSH